MKRNVTLLAAAVTLAAACTGWAQDAAPVQKVLFTNVNVFDGTSDTLHQNMNVLVVGNLIDTVSSEGIVVDPSTNTTMIDGGGRTLMPGLIESHVHLNLQHMIGGYETIEKRDWQEIGAMAAFAARSLLMDGFTTVRDMGTLQTGMRRAIDSGNAVGPRIYHAGAVIGQTSGHGDWRPIGYRTLEGRQTFKVGQLGMSFIVDGYDANLSAARQNLANGSVFNKIMTSGGVFSSKDPLHTVQMNADEIRAVVEASEAWGTYVSMHVFNVSDVVRAVEIGVKEAMHVPFLDLETAKFMAEKGIFYNPQLSGSSQAVIDATFGPGDSVNKSKAMTVSGGLLKIPGILKEVTALQDRTVFGADVVTNSPADVLKARDFEISLWAENFGNFQTLKAMTSIGGDVANLTGKINPYPEGRLGVIAKGAYADILIVDGNPLEDMSVIGANPSFSAAPRNAGGISTMRLIMKGGKIYKNTL
jgi:imidazolonepropionase-like amidohydrolase